MSGRTQEGAGKGTGSRRDQHEHGHPYIRFHLDPYVFPPDASWQPDHILQNRGQGTGLHLIKPKETVQKGPGAGLPRIKLLPCVSPEEIPARIPVKLPAHGGKRAPALSHHRQIVVKISHPLLRFRQQVLRPLLFSSSGALTGPARQHRTRKPAAGRRTGDG